MRYLESDIKVLIDEKIRQILDNNDLEWLGWNWRKYRIGEKVSRSNKN